MLGVHNNKVDIGNYPDGTLLLKPSFAWCSQKMTIIWRYENDSELFALYSLTRHFQGRGCEVHLLMPYIPNARMDRVKDSEDVFTLKYFAEIINSLSFESVTVVDPHSSVSEALIERLHIIRPDVYILDTISRIKSNNLLMFYPDEGAMKRYSGTSNAPYAFGIKSRDWKTGKILGLEIMGEKVLIEGSDILIVDDICSRGGTFFYAAKALKEYGAKNIYLFVTHCENTILEGEVLTSGLIEKVYTTDSICTVEHEKVEVINL